MTLALPCFASATSSDSLLADDVDRGGVVEVENDVADRRRSLPRPVVERLLDEKIKRHDHPPLVFQANHHIGRRYFFDPAVLVLHRDGVFEPDRLRDRKLHAGDEVAQHRLCGETENDAGDPGRGEQAYAVLAHRFEGHQRKAQGDEHDNGVEDARQHAYLGDVFACQQVVVDIDTEAHQVEIGGEDAARSSPSSRAGKWPPTPGPARSRSWCRIRAALWAARWQAQRAADRSASDFWSHREPIADRAGVRATAGAGPQELRHATATPPRLPPPGAPRTRPRAARRRAHCLRHSMPTGRFGRGLATCRELYLETHQEARELPVGVCPIVLWTAPPRGGIKRRLACNCHMRGRR